MSALVHYFMHKIGMRNSCASLVRKFSPCSPHMSLRVGVQGSPYYCKARYCLQKSGQFSMLSLL